MEPFLSSRAIVSALTRAPPPAFYRKSRAADDGVCQIRLRPGGMVGRLREGGVSAFERVVTVRERGFYDVGIDALSELRMQLQGVCYVRTPVGALRLGSQPVTKHVGRTRWTCDP